MFTLVTTVKFRLEVTGATLGFIFKKKTYEKKMSIINKTHLDEQSVKSTV